MNNKLTYIEARDKIWNAYFRDEIKPFNAEFCFCGTLNDGKLNWTTQNITASGYSGSEMFRMESGLYSGLEILGLKTYGRLSNCNRIENYEAIEQHPKYEDAIFAAMLAALEVLKQIHRDRGEIIPEDEPLLTKRSLTPYIR